MNMNPVVWFEIYVADMPRARAFYEAMLAVRLEPLADPTADDGTNLEMWAFPGQPEGAGACGTLARMEGCTPGGNGTLVYFGCDDCAVEAARAVASGGRLVRDKFAIGPHGFIALVEDTEGNVVGLHSMK
ncbi:VOC family protein [Zobellella sp. An-6]|uniref:VOC family protein n=1 Tax=Zobellella sp. An-6 TaxID=3400218 RepID=UPI004042532A